MDNVYITLTSGERCRVDEPFLPFLSLFRWHRQSAGYAIGKVCGRLTLMHRLILNASANDTVDHLNGNPLDNRRDNLRFCTQTQNMQNRQVSRTRQYKGVSFDSRDGKYHAQICVNGTNYSFCYSTDPNECAIAYDAAARYHFGQFAKTNFPGTDATPAHLLVTAKRNVKNSTSRFRGVRKTTSGRWQALFMSKHIGVFATEEEAAAAYDATATAALGDKAIVNFRQT